MGLHNPAKKAIVLGPFWTTFTKFSWKSLVLRLHWRILKRKGPPVWYPWCPLTFSAKYPELGENDCFGCFTVGALQILGWETIFSSESPSPDAELAIVVGFFQNSFFCPDTMAFFAGFWIPEIQILGELLACLLKILKFRNNEHLFRMHTLMQIMIFLSNTA